MYCDGVGRNPDAVALPAHTASVELGNSMGNAASRRRRRGLPRHSTSATPPRGLAAARQLASAGEVSSHLSLRKRENEPKRRTTRPRQGPALDLLPPLPRQVSPMPSPPSDRVYTALFLLSLAVRPLPDGDSSHFIQIDRTDIWRMARAAGIPVGRNRFLTAIADISERDITDDNVAENGNGKNTRPNLEAALVLVSRQANRRAVRIERPDADDYNWAEELLPDLGFDDLDAAIEAATAYGFDCGVELPASVLHTVRLPAEDEDEDEDEDDAAGCEAAEAAVKDCTKCRTSQPLDAFSIRANGRPSSWCRTCTKAVTAAWKKAHPGRVYESRPTYALRSWPEVYAAQPVEKVCRGCRTVKRAVFFANDRHHADGLSSRCRACRSNESVGRGPRALLPVLPHHTNGLS